MLKRFPFPTGYSLWKADDLKKIEVHRNDSTDYSINKSNSLSEKFKKLDTSASVQLSILSELVKLKGSAETAMIRNSTVSECSVQVKCFYKTGYKEMDMDQLTNIAYLDVAKTGNNNTATHFVTKIQYGAGAIFTFTKQFQSSEDEMKVKDEIDICGTNIQSVLNGSFEENYRHISNSSQIKCEFKSFGLSLSEALPTTYGEAPRFAGIFARTAQQSFARHGGEALGIPCIVWLHPLVTLPGCAKAPKLHWDFTPDQACRWVKFFEDCDMLELNLLKLKRLQFEFKLKKLALIRKIYFIYFFLLSEAFVFSFFLRNFEKENKNHYVLDRKIEFVTQLRSESKTKLKEMLVEIRSGTKTFEYFQKQTQFFTSRLDGLSELVAEKNQGNPLVLWRTFKFQSIIDAIEQYECS